MEKTILEWFNELPEPIRSQAINNLSKSSEAIQQMKADSLAAAIDYGITWKTSTQGYDFWEDIFNKAKSGEFDNPQPTKPTHYDFAIQPIDYIEANGLGFCEGNVIKYVTRYKLKGGVEDLKKAKHYLEILIERNQPK